jgi:predicted protein tyrosine phosphatase
MKIAVCALADLDLELGRQRPSRVVSLMNPDHAAPCLARTPHLVLRFNDLAAPRAGYTAPGGTAIAQLLHFVSGAGPGETVLVHCWMGVSRSPAAAFILACARRPQIPERQIAETLRAASPSATPNAMLVSLADAHLRREGRMAAAIAAIGRGTETRRGMPFMLEV